MHIRKAAVIYLILFKFDTVKNDSVYMLHADFSFKLNYRF
jgi:hypothetical protein